MNKIIVSLVALPLATFAAGAVFVVPAMGEPGKGQEKVGVCHRTASESNPYVWISVPADEANGHITGTDKQHNHKVYWPVETVWNGVTHPAGSERLDYYSESGCENTTVTPSEEPSETPTEEPTVAPTETVTPTVPPEPEGPQPPGPEKPPVEPDKNPEVGPPGERVNGPQKAPGSPVAVPTAVAAGT